MLVFFDLIGCTHTTRARLFAGLASASFFAARNAALRFVRGVIVGADMLLGRGLGRVAGAATCPLLFVTVPFVAGLGVCSEGDGIADDGRGTLIAIREGVGRAGEAFNEA